jgi:hypothetical protein
MKLNWEGELSGGCLFYQKREEVSGGGNCQSYQKQEGEMSGGGNVSGECLVAGEMPWTHSTLQPRD